jgi:restriction system protein
MKGEMDQLRNRTKKRQKEIDSIIGFLMLVSGLVGWYTAGTLKGVGIAIGIGFGIVLLFSLWQSLRFKKRMQQSRMTEIDQMTGIEFEEYLGTLFKNQGYHVTYTPTTGDYGADLILKKDKEVIVVQAKRYNQTVGVKAVQEVIPAIKMYKATAAWVITNSTYTKQSLTLAKSNHVRMIGREELITMSLKFRGNIEKSKNKVRSTNIEPADLIAATIQDDSFQISNDELMARLKSFRSKTAKEAGLKAYHVFTNKTLDDLVAKRPLTINDLQGIDGLGQKRIEAYGAQLVTVINTEE